MSYRDPSENDVAFTPSPEPAPGPDPQSFPLPWPPDWWRCLRRGPVSGRYYGEMTAPKAARYTLDLRVDIDPRHANSPVMDHVSGDIYQLYGFQWGRRTFTWRVYRESWIMDSPTVNWSKCSVRITGNVRFWNRGHPATDVAISIPWSTFRSVGPAEVTLTEVGASGSTYSCPRQSNAFRDVTLEVDVCASVNNAPILPTYDTHAHPNRPADLPQRTLTIEEAYMEAGVALTINPTRSIIDDTALTDTNWLPSELHDAMETYFSRISGTWPKWHVWALLASGVFEDPVDGLLPGVGGIMFDASVPGGAYEPPERQGCAVFRDHSWFDNLVANPPANDAQAASMRQYLYTYVHEIGHAFNYLHSWDKNRPDALSWMNYGWRYDILNGADSYWANFEFMFDSEELIHLRHGDRASVIMGGDPWSSGGHLEAPIGALADLVEQAPVELLVRSKPYFQFMEPVNIELRIRNIADHPLEVDPQLHPEYGSVVVYIRRPDGRTLEYAPIFCKVATPELKVLKPGQEAVTGEDRHSQNVFLSYGAYGHYFDEPGHYLLRAVYHGAGDILVPSNIFRVRVGRPFSREEERDAQDFFAHQAGMALYLNGSSSRFLENGMSTLERMASRYQESPLGAHLSHTLARNLARPFRPVKDGVRVEARAANPEEALAFTKRALEQDKRDESTFTNITYHQLCRARADQMVAIGKKAEAKKELDALAKELDKRGVNKPVLNDIRGYAKKL